MDQYLKNRIKIEPFLVDFFLIFVGFFLIFGGFFLIFDGFFLIFDGFFPHFGWIFFIFQEDNGAVFRCTVWNRALGQRQKLEHKITLQVNCKFIFDNSFILNIGILKV